MAQLVLSASRCPEVFGVRPPRGRDIENITAIDNIRNFTVSGPVGGQENLSSQILALCRLCCNARGLL